MNLEKDWIIYFQENVCFITRVIDLNARLVCLNFLFLSIFKATPIYLLVLRAQEVGNEPFWNKKKVEICDFFYLFYF